jgi:hypothetical protein
MLVVPLLVNTVSFVFTVRIIPPLFLLVYPLWFSHNPFSPHFDREVSLFKWNEVIDRRSREMAEGLVDARPEAEMIGDIRATLHARRPTS